MTSTVAILFAMALPLQAQTRPTRQTLDTLRGRNRVLLVFAPDSRGARLRSQLAQLDGKAMAERDLVLIPFLNTWSPGDEYLQIKRTSFNSDEEQVRLRRRFHIHPNDFIVILIGKDGGEKFRSHTSVTIERLNRIIDTMPMRQQEMRSRLVP